MADYYYCEDCDSIFPQGSAATVTVPDGYGYKEIDACPYCRNTQLDVARSCKICGEPIEPGKDYCDECNYKAHKIWEEAVCKIMDIADFDKDYCDCEGAFLEYLENSGVF